MSGGGSGGGGQTTTSIQQIDPVMRPFIQYGLEESARLYQNPDIPQFYPGQTYVGPSQQTQAALAAAQQRATMGNPLVPAAQQAAQQTIQGGFLNANPATQSLQGTIGGQFLSGNPFFEGAFRGATAGAQTAYQDATQAALSNASRAGRYGSGAMGTALDRAGGVFANALTNTAGQLAYQNYDAERARQMAAIGMSGDIYSQERGRQQAMIGAAPQLAAADYADIGQLMQTGQIAEGYQDVALQDAVNRFNFAQQAPYQKLQSYLSGAYGAPMGTQGSVTTPTYGRSQAAGALGGAATGAAIGSTFGPYGAAIGGGVGLLGGLL
jgi:hypothetical protein